MKFKALQGLIYLLFLVLASLQGVTQPATVWIVRHAEKDVSDPKNADPELSADGQQRSKDLAIFLNGKGIDAFFSTPYKRTNQTAAPLAGILGKTVSIYAPATPEMLVKECSDKFTGKEIVVVGHSNTVLELIEAFGGKRPLPALTNDDYDYIFKLTREKNQPVSTELFHFGKPHHAAMVVK